MIHSIIFVLILAFTAKSSASPEAPADYPPARPSISIFRLPGPETAGNWNTKFEDYLNQTVVIQADPSPSPSPRPSLAPSPSSSSGPSPGNETEFVAIPPATANMNGLIAVMNQMMANVLHGVMRLQLNVLQMTTTFSQFMGQDAEEPPGVAYHPSGFGSMGALMVANRKELLNQLRSDEDPESIVTAIHHLEVSMSQNLEAVRAEIHSLAKTLEGRRQADSGSSTGQGLQPQPALTTLVNQLNTLEGVFVNNLQAMQNQMGQFMSALAQSFAG